MPRQKKQKQKKETRKERLDKEINKQLNENKDKTGEAEAWPEDHYLAAHRIEGGVLYTTVPKEIIDNGGNLADKYKLVGIKLGEPIRLLKQKYSLMKDWRRIMKKSR